MPGQFRIACVTMVASECDIIESFARHTLCFADRLHIQFHNSYDASQEIVERLVAEGLPITFERGGDPAFRREPMGDRLARNVAGDGRFDFIAPLDADEFIVADDRAVLEDELARIAPGGALSVNWLAYVPTEQDEPGDPNPVTRIRHRVRTPSPVRKVFFAAATLAQDDIYLSDGNHLLLSHSGREIPHLPSQRVCLAHFPVRSAQQLASKVAIGGAARLLSPDFNENKSPHWRALTRDPAIGADTPMRELSRRAIDFLNCGDQELIEAPLSSSVRALKYHDLIKVDAFQRLSAFVSAVLAHRAVTGESAGGDLIERQRLLAEVETSRHTVQELYQRIETNDRARAADLARAGDEVQPLKDELPRLKARVRRYQWRMWTLGALAVIAAFGCAALLAFR